MPFSTSDGVRLWTATTGTTTSAPPVVILHGGPGLWDDHAVLADMLDDLTVVHRFDQRGCGRSGPSDEQTMARLAQDIDELRAVLGPSADPGDRPFLRRHAGVDVCGVVPRSRRRSRLSRRGRDR